MKSFVSLTRTAHKNAWPLFAFFVLAIGLVTVASFWPSANAAHQAAFRSNTTRQHASSPVPAAAKAVFAPCGAMTITRLSSTFLYVDKDNPAVASAQYVGYQIKNDTGAPITDLWVQLTTTGTIVMLNEDGLYHVGPLAVNATANVYFYVKMDTTQVPGNGTTAAQAQTVALYEGNPGSGGTLVCGGNSFSYTVEDLIDANANKPDSVTISGDTNACFTVSVTGTTGTIGSHNNDNVTYTPAANLGFPADAYELTGTNIVYTGGPGGGVNDKLFVSGLSASNKVYTISYSFCKRQNVALPAFAPLTYIASGANNDKYEPVDPATAVQLSALKTVSPATPVAVGTTLTYTITITNTGTVAATSMTLVDPIPANTTYVANMTTLNTIAVPDNGSAPFMPYSTVREIHSPGEPNGTINVGESATVVFKVTVNNALPNGVTQIPNTATYAGAANIVPSTNTNTVITPLTASLRLQKALANGRISNNDQFIVQILNGMTLLNSPTNSTTTGTGGTVTSGTGTTGVTSVPLGTTLTLTEVMAAGSDPNSSLGTPPCTNCYTTTISCVNTNGGSSTGPPLGSGQTYTINLQNASDNILCALINTNSNAPTAVRMAGAEARATAAGVKLHWRTGFEVDNLGFNVYREENGKRALVTPGIVAGSALLVGARTRLEAGHHYNWVDPHGSADAVYWIEDLDLDGSSSWHGPIYPQASRKSAIVEVEADEQITSRNSQLLSQLGRDLATDETATHDVTPAAGFRDFSLALAQTAVLSSSRSELTGNVPRRARSLADVAALKICVKQEGWYRFTQAQLVAAGFAAPTDPRALRLYVDGYELPINVTGSDDRRFDAADAIEFYGMGLDTPATDTRVYWLISDNTNSVRIKRLPFTSTTSAGASFAHTVERRDRIIYFSNLLNGPVENFFGGIVEASTPLDQSLRVPGVNLAATTSATLVVCLQGVTAGAHAVSVKFNGTQIGFLNFADKQQGKQTFNIPHNLVLEGENKVTLQSTAGAADFSLVESLRLTYQRKYQADNDALTASVPAFRQVKINGFTGGNIRVFDVTEEFAVTELETKVQASGNVFSVSATPQGAGVRRLLAFKADRPSAPAVLKKNIPSGWFKSTNRADLVIVTHGLLMAEIAPLANLRSKQSLGVVTVDIEDVYDELNHGHKSVNALSNFLKFAATVWQLKPRYVLLAGDASFDPRNYRGKGDTDLVPTRLMDVGTLEAPCDDALVDFNNDNLPDLAIGRLPARTAVEARRMVTRLLAYETAALSTENVFVADVNNGYNFEAFSNDLSNMTPSGQTRTKIYRGQLGDAAARTQLLAALNRGPRLVNYSGHGAQDHWSGNIFVSADATALTNNNQASLYIMMTCLNGYFIDSNVESLAEALLRSSTGGAIAVWAGSSLTGAIGQNQINRVALPLIFTSGKRLGDLTREAKAMTSDIDVRRSWILFGDPTMRMR
jgi:uncharacterized repeat protein (TIGR01451 family)